MDNESTKNKPSILTPLWVVSIFVSLTETMTGIGVIQTTGGVQISLTAFVILFPTAVASAFFLILWHRPYVLYSPGEYGHKGGVSEYVQAMQKKQAEGQRVINEINETFRNSLTSPELISEITKTVKEAGKNALEKELNDILRKAADQTAKSIESIFVTIDSTPLLSRDGTVWQQAYNPNQSVDDFLDLLWYSIADHVRAFTYGDSWVLKDTHSGKVFHILGSKYAEKNKLKYDKRSLSEVGIQAGHRLEIIYPQSKK